MLVLARQGIKVPTEENPHAYITDTAPEGKQGYEVPESTYYLRRLHIDRDLVLVEPSATEAPAADAAAGTDVAAKAMGKQTKSKE